MGTDSIADKRENAHFEHISIPNGQSFIWRMDDYPWRRNVWNFHPQAELHLIRKSSGLCYIGDYIGPFNPGDLFLVGGGLPHNWITLPEGGSYVRNRDVVVQFDATAILKAAEHLVEMGELGALFDRAQFGLLFDSRETADVRTKIENLGHADGLDRLIRFLELLRTLANDVSSRTLATPRYLTRFRPGDSKELRQLEVALDLLQQHFRREIRIGEVASKVGMSESTFSRFFKRQTGNSFTQHVTSLRIWMARRLLMESDLAITDICYEAGFSNISNFNRVFLRQTGMRPSEYRRAVKNFL